MKIQKQFGEKIRSLRVAKGFSQEKLAELSGLHRTYISTVELGKRNVSLANIEALAKALEVSPDELLRFE